MIYFTDVGSSHQACDFFYLMNFNRKEERGKELTSLLLCLPLLKSFILIRVINYKEKSIAIDRKNI